MTTVSVIIPSFDRPAALARCLAGVDRMSTVPDEIGVVLRPEDAEGRRVATAAGARIIDVFEPGHLPPLAAAASACRADVFGVLDDDAVPHVDWLARIHQLFGDPSTVAVTGPVRQVDAGGNEIGDRRAARRAARRLERRGARTWYKGFAGLPPPGACERRGVQRPVDVSTLQGGNAAYRCEAFQRIGVDLAMNRGAAIGYEADLALGLRESGRVLFDPGLIVDHFPAKRAGAPDRDAPETAIADYTFNLFHIATKHFGPTELAVFRAYMTTLGQRPSPGLLRIASVAAAAGIPIGDLFGRVREARRGGTSSGREARLVSHSKKAC
jgi:GT2 family glycosyltransferase